MSSVSLVHVGGGSSDSAHKHRLMRAARTRYYMRHGGLPAALAYRAILVSADFAGWTLGRLRGRSARVRRIRQAGTDRPLMM